MLRFLTAGESHGKGLMAILDGMVAGLKIKESEISAELSRRQEGYGRGGRMAIEKDEAEILSGVRSQVTIGSPIALWIKNRDFKINELPVVKCPRPGHADLTGVLKYDREDIRDILERASARETTARVAVGAVCKKFLSEFDVEVISHVVNLGGITADTSGYSFDEIKERAKISPMRCACPKTTKRMMAKVDVITAAKDTVGGVIEVIARGVPCGLGSYTQFDRRLSAELVAALACIPAIKGVETGLGFAIAGIPGSSAHDEIYYDKKKGFYRKTNRAGGLEGGMTNGDPIVLRAVMKPISTLMRPLKSVNIDSKKVNPATVERSDVTAVPAAGIVAEAMVAFTLAKAFLEKFGGDSLRQTLANHASYVRNVRLF